jgi:hypothetical protein
MSRSERDKGARGEREVATILRFKGLDVRRVPNSGGLQMKGDLTGVQGYHFEVKRQETIRMPAWLKQAYDEAAPGDVPVVVHRTNHSGWYATLPLHDLATLLDLARLAT